ncbi:MAG TPA: twin-arginine translocation signal domain-containing protein [Stellaceae bacterium]|nr:twin-arginine translocation signal domain-containing protein [Stellaceae bacterium]
MVSGTRRDFLRLAGAAAGLSVMSLSTLRSPAAEAATLVCTHAAPAVRVNVRMPDPVLDSSQPQRAIQALASPGYHGGRTVGLYYAEMNAKLQTQFRSLSMSRAAPACVYITAVDLNIVMPARRIYVASELWEGTCPYTAVLGHERKHQAVDDLVVSKHTPHLQQAIQDAVLEVGPLDVSANGREAVQARLQRAVKSAFDKAWSAFQAERTELQRQVDAGLEYARVTASCPDWSQLQH